MWLNTLLSGICVATAAWIAVAFGADTGRPSNDVAMYIGEAETETEAADPVADLLAVPDFPELQPMPIRNMLAPQGVTADADWATKRHEQRLADARRRNAVAAIQQPVGSSGHSPRASNATDNRRSRMKARRLQAAQAQQKYQRRQKTIFERTRHYSDNAYAYQYNNSDGRRNSRVSTNRSRSMRVPVATRRRR